MRWIIKNKILAIIFVALSVRLFLMYTNLSDISHSIQQDNYANYAEAIKNGTLDTTFPSSDKRLFPGYPVLIYMFTYLIPAPIHAGLTINIISSLLIIFIMWKITRDTIATVLIAFFPPIWIEQGSKVATEPVFILFCLLSLSLYLKKNYILAGILAGLALDVRLIAISFFAALLIPLIRKNLWKNIFYLFLGFFAGLALLLSFNILVFGSSETLQQFIYPSRYGGIRLGIIQLANDFYRTIDWGQYKIFLSGSFYIFTNVLALIILFTLKKKSILSKIFLNWLLFSLFFILTFSPSTLLDDFGRYTLAALPAYIYAFTLILHFYNKKRFFISFKFDRFIKNRLTKINEK